MPPGGTPNKNCPMSSLLKPNSQSRALACLLRLLNFVLELPDLGNVHVSTRAKRPSPKCYAVTLPVLLPECHLSSTFRPDTYEDLFCSRSWTAANSGAGARELFISHSGRSKQRLTSGLTESLLVSSALGEVKREMVQRGNIYRVCASKLGSVTMCDVCLGGFCQFVLVISFPLPNPPRKNLYVALLAETRQELT